jgi:hypothetical protein
MGGSGGTESGNSDVFRGGEGMNWIDIRVRKPEEKDSFKGKVWALFDDGSSGCKDWGWVASGDSIAIAWLDPKTLPKFTPIPDPPEGYRWVDKEADKPQLADDLYWSYGVQAWRMCVVGTDSFCRDDAYARRIDPPKPQYRRFENAAEFEPFADRWVRCKPEKCETYRICAYNDQLFWMGTAVKGVSFEEGLRDYCFSDGTPFGLPV